jgi:hypothetical protein
MTKLTIKNIKEGFLLFFAQTISFALISLNYRAIAQANYLYTGLTDVFIAMLTFFVVRKIAQTQTTISHWIGYTIGSVLGSFMGIFISKFVLGS